MPNLKLPSQFHSVKFLGRGGAHISDIPLLFETRCATPDLVILDIGTNDLASLTPTQTLAVNVFKAAESMLKAGVKRIVILETLYRTPVGKHGAPPLFNTRVRQLNSQLKSLIKNHIHMEYWYHKGLASRITNYLSDGVHLNVEGTRKYVRSLRQAVRKYTRDLQQQNDYPIIPAHTGVVCSFLTLAYPGFFKLPHM